MKRITALLCAAALCLLCACGTTAQPFTPKLVNDLLESDIFSEPLEPLDKEIACFVYQLDPDQTNLTDLKAYRSAGATYEEVAVLIFEAEADASAVLTTMQSYLAARLADCKSYMPDQVPKLEHAMLAQRDNTILLLVADDWTAAQTLVK